MTKSDYDIQIETNRVERIKILRWSFFCKKLLQKIIINDNNIYNQSLTMVIKYFFEVTSLNVIKKIVWSQRRYH